MFISMMEHNFRVILLYSVYWNYYCNTDACQDKGDESRNNSASHPAADSIFCIAEIDINFKFIVF